MGLGHSPRIVTDGLVLALDAGNPKNYNAGISTNWTDKVGGNNGTLVGGTYHNDGPFVGAGYVEFDGSGDYLQVTANSDLSLTGDFTVEYWTYLKGSSANMRQISTGNYYTSGKNGNWSFGINTTSSTNNVAFGSYDGQSNFEKVVAPYTQASLNSWYHLAATRVGSTVRLFVNGELVASGTISKSLVDGADGGLQIGRLTTYGDHNGYISNLRIVKGTALYTSNFTPPTGPLTAVTNTKLLTCQGNTISPGTDIVVTTSNKGSGSVGSLSAVTSSGNYYFDNRSASPSTASIQLDFKTVQTGVTQIKLSGGGYAVGALFDLYVNGVLVENDRSTVTLWGEDTITISSTNISSIKIEGSDGYSLGALKFNGTLVSGTISEIVPNGDISLTKEPFAGAGAVKFDGSGDRLSASSSDFSLDGDFTVEYWIQSQNNTGNSGYVLHFGGGNTSYFGTKSGSYVLQANNNGEHFWTGVPTINTWVHLALVRSGSTVTLYEDGISLGNKTESQTFGNSTFVIADWDGQFPVTGYISNFRIIKGTAVYTSNFTPPSRTLEPIENTVLLTCQGQNIKDYSSSANAITVNGDAKATIVSSAFEFDGTNDCVDVTNNANLYPGTGDFTAEVWCRGESATSDYHYLLSNYGNSGSNYYGWGIATQSNGSGIVAWVQSGSGATQVVISNTTVNLNDSNWHHVVFVRSGNAIRLYHNGEQLESDGDVTGYNVTSSEAKFRIGKVRDAADPNGGYYFWNGKISGVKIYKGKALTASEVQQNYNATKGRYA